MNKVSSKGVLEIAEHEGLVLGPYYDSKKILTYGIGHTIGAGLPDPNKMPKVDTTKWTDTQVNAEVIKILKLFAVDLQSYEDRVNRAIKVPVRQHQFDALVSFDFNTGGIFKANLTKAINSGDMSGAGFMGWVKPKEVMGRRRAEQALFQTGDYSANGDFIPVYDTLANGKIKYRYRISGRELDKLLSEVTQPTVVIKPTLWDIILGLLGISKNKP